MLVEFSVQNYGCFKGCQTLFMTATGRHSPDDVRIISGGKVKVFKAAAIFGESGSGKSQMLEALKTFCAIVVNGWGTDSVPQNPHREAGTPADPASMLEIKIAIGDTIYRYGMTLIDGRIESEWLFSRNGRREQRLFHRDETGVIVSKSLQPYHKLMKILLPGTPVLSLSLKFDIPLIAPVASWLGKVYLSNHHSAMAFQRRVDFGHQILPVDMAAPLYAGLGLGSYGGVERWPTTNGPGSLTSGDLAILALVPTLSKVLETGGLLLLDDMDAHLPHAALRALLGFFYDDLRKGSPAQLVFTTHLQDWVSEGKWLMGQRYVIDRVTKAANLQQWTMPARRLPG